MTAMEHHEATEGESDSREPCSNAAHPASPNKPVPLIPLTGGNLDGARIDALVFYPTHLKEIATNWRVGMAAIDEKEVVVVQGTSSKQDVNLYFDAESGLLHDYEVWLERLAPHAPVGQYHHNRTGEDNADAHLKRQVMGREVVVAITKGKLDFGPWEQIFYGEFDGRRRKRVLVKIIGE